MKRLHNEDPAAAAKLSEQWGIFSGQLDISPHAQLPAGAAPPVTGDRPEVKAATLTYPKELTRAHWQSVKQEAGSLGRPLGPTGIGEALDRLEAAIKDWDFQWLPRGLTKDDNIKAKDYLEKAKAVNKLAHALAKKASHQYAFRVGTDISLLLDKIAATADRFEKESDPTERAIILQTAFAERRKQLLQKMRDLPAAALQAVTRCRARLDQVNTLSAWNEQERAVKYELRRVTAILRDIMEVDGADDKKYGRDRMAPPDFVDVRWCERALAILQPFAEDDRKVADEDGFDGTRETLRAILADMHKECSRWAQSAGQVTGITRQEGQTG